VGHLDVMQHNTKLNFSFILVNHRLKLWNIRGMVWEECPTIASHFALEIYFVLHHMLKKEGARSSNNV
jgi:hypothetical protein